MIVAAAPLQWLLSATRCAKNPSSIPLLGNCGVFTVVTIIIIIIITKKTIILESFFLKNGHYQNFFSKLQPCSFGVYGLVISCKTRKAITTTTTTAKTKQTNKPILTQI